MDIIPIVNPDPATEQQVAPFLQSALAQGGYVDWDLSQVLNQVRLGRWGLAGVYEDGGRLIGAGVVCIQQFGKRSVLEVILFGSEKNANVYEGALSYLRDVARQLGCSAIRCEGRKGWAKALKAKRINMIEIEV